ncbi:MAG: protein-glutamate methylesterase/protein-glutamine glutaminase [Eubacteriaceae bacterium]
MAIKLLVVDDSAFMRKVIGDLISEIEGIKIVGIARNGLEALENIPRLKPDVITMDIEMPKLNGIDTLKRVKDKYKIPVIMLSSHSGTDVTMEALEIGAVDFIEKPANLNADLVGLKNELEIKIKTAFQISMPSEKTSNKIKYDNNRVLLNSIQAVAIGASTGGPKALFYLISKIPEKIKVPIFIVQHMPKGFTKSLACRLDNECNMKVVEAENDMNINRNTIYVAPGDWHMTINENKIKLNSREKLFGVRPAVDYLFESASEVYSDKLLGIILTGMGRDGTNGMVSIKENGGYNLAQSEESCVVYGMPRSAVSKGVVDDIMNLETISMNLNKLVKVK